MPYVTLALLITAGLLIWFERNPLLDWVKLRGYHPSSAISQLADQTTMTKYARRLFYVNKPAVQSKASFNVNCPNSSHEVAVLGCFRGDRLGIYIYNVTDQRLYGIEQVTAAHEMLHQAYTRLSSSERAHINQLLEAYYTAKTTDQDLKDKIAGYQKTEPKDLDNEMHSVFGTEAKNLPPELEAYYRRYFSNREQVVAYHAQYEAAFTQRQDQIAAYNDQLKTLKPQIDANNTKIDQYVQQLTAERTQMNQWRSSGDLERYNAAVPGFNQQVAAYKQLLASNNALIDQYNGIMNQRSAIAVEEEQLLKAQDSHASSVGTQ